MFEPFSTEKAAEKLLKNEAFWHMIKKNRLALLRPEMCCIAGKQL